MDSAVTAALLQDAGAKVTGVFIKGWYPSGLPCTWAADRRDAMRVAARLSVPFITLDASAEYKKSVIDYLIREYGAGRTPNPDIMCNRDVKFGAFFRYAIEHGADFIATGHYARIVHEEREKNTAAERRVRENVPPRSGFPVEQYFSHVLRGIDPAKDQSYFLWAVPKETLLKVLFPLGDLKKDAVRILAQKFNLPVASKKDSQGICFLGAVSIEDFLRAEMGLAQGKAYDESGREIGTHAGAIAYTLGERASLGDASGGPWYVTRKDLARNSLTVSHEPMPAVPEESGEWYLSDTNWLITPDKKEYSAQYRYHGPLVAGTFSTDRTSFIASHNAPHLVAPGQSLVFYDRDILVGGGIIL